MLRVAEHWWGTDTGLQRRANEDSLLVRSPLFVVADGMGGAQAGEVASRVAVETFRDGLGDGADPEASLARQVSQANARINELSLTNIEHAGMGTTITAVYVGEQEVSVAHVGDSRAYCLRDGELLRLTEDHSLVDELIRQGKLTPEEAEEHPQRSIITRALGPEATVEVDTRSFRARPQDVYLICSDGLTTMVGEGALTELLLAHTHLRDAGEALIAAANQAGGKDNITVVLFRLEELDTSAAAVALDGEVTMTDMAPVVPRRPRSVAPAPVISRTARTRRRLRRMRVLFVGLAVLGFLAAGAYLGLQSVYFIGTNKRGLVTVFNGLPYQLPGGLNLYTSTYVSGVSASTLTTERRQTLLDHSLRTETNAGELVRELELGQLNEG
jgi:protein phosphatase